MPRMKTLATVLLVVLAVAALGGCKEIRRALHWTSTIESPTPESPEWVVQQAIIAGMMESEKEGWAAFRSLLHSGQLASPASESSWRSMNFQSMRRKIRLYLADDTKPIYELSYVEEIREDELKVFVVNEGSELPTPCTVKRDPGAEGKWRISICSL